MSFISIIICDHYLSVMADSRASVLDISGAFFKVKNDNVEKICMTSDVTFYTISGLYEDAIDFLTKSNFTSLIKADGTLKDKTGIITWFSENRHLLLQRDFLSYDLYFGGYSFDEDNFVLYSIDGKTQNIDFKYGDESPSYTLAYSNEYIGNKNLEDYFIELCLSNDPIDAQKLINDYVADNDPTVNKTTYGFILSRIGTVINFNYSFYGS